MAKKKAEQSIGHRFEFRLKPTLQTRKQRSKWAAITEDDMAKVKKMEPHRYEFQEIEPLKPTESMVVKEKED